MNRHANKPHRPQRKANFWPDPLRKVDHAGRLRRRKRAEQRQEERDKLKK